MLLEKTIGKLLEEIADKTDVPAGEYVKPGKRKNVIIWLALLIVAVNPVGCVKLYFEASAPFNVKFGVTAIPLPTFASAKTAEFDKETSSVPTKPFKGSEEIIAANEPSYVLSLTTTFETVNVFWFIVKVWLTDGAIL